MGRSASAVLGGGALVAVLLGLWVFTGGGSPSSGALDPSVRLVALANGAVATGLEFRFQPFDEPRLAELGRRERLDQVVAGAAGEFEGVLRLKDWVAAQWPEGEPDPYPPWSALEILDWIRAGKTGGFCAQYSQVFVQALAYLGLTARYVESGTRENPTAHYPVEVWSNEHDKWILMDAYYNLHFERDGVPQSALEVHRGLTRGEAARLRAVPGAVRAGHPDPGAYPLRTAELYYYLRFHLKADHLTRPHDPFNRWSDMVEWEDAETVPWARSPAPSDLPKERLTREATRDPAEAYSKLNQVHVTIRGAHPGRLDLAFEHSVLQFREYEVRLGRDGGAWRPLRADTYAWTLAPGENVLGVRGTNVRGVAGPPATLAVVYHQP